MMLDLELERLIGAWLEGRINESDSLALQQRLRDSAEDRARFRAFANLDAAMYGIASGELNMKHANSLSTHPPGTTKTDTKKSSHAWLGIRLATWVQLACAAVLLVTVAGLAYQFGKTDTADSSSVILVDRSDVTEESAEMTIAGHATLRRVAGIAWKSAENTYREGDVLPAGLLEFENGVVEIDFFCGATVIVEGPAKLDLESDWSVRLLAGRLRANVPPAARGFVVKAADSEIVDLGTEFALEVSSEKVRVEVVDGEIELRGGAFDGEHLVTGESQSLVGSNADSGAIKNLRTGNDVRRLQLIERRERFEHWKANSHKLREDSRLIAYYPISESTVDRHIANAAATGSELDGKLVGLVDRSEGRFGESSTGLGFGWPGSRVRARIDGEFDALSFACWVKIDSLEHQYNALFMGDGYENGEPHWQIRNDGRLMFSVMVDDTPGSGDGKATDARLHKIYLSEQVWDRSMSGKWIHLAAVYNPQAKQVSHFVNGNCVIQESIMPKFHVEKLRIGPAEIGNWGQPFRRSPEFAVRNLNGTIDEMAIFGVALTADEVLSIYDQGKPFAN